MLASLKGIIMSYLSVFYLFIFFLFYSQMNTKFNKLRLTNFIMPSKLIFRARPTSFSWCREFRYACLGSSCRYCDGHTYDSWFRYMLPTISRVQDIL